MHEYSLIRSLIRQVGEIVKAEGGGAVETVHVNVGIFSGVEVALLELAFQDLAASHFEQDARLLINRVPLSLQCRDCGSITQTEEISFQCQLCSSPFVRIVDGDQVELLEINIVGAVATKESSE